MALLALKGEGSSGVRHGVVFEKFSTDCPPTLEHMFESWDNFCMDHLPTRLRDTADAVASFGAEFAGLADETLLEAQAVLAEHRRTVDVFSAALASEIDRRSARQLGHDGLAQRLGFVSPAALIQSVTGGTRSEAAKFVSVGAQLDSVVGAAVLDGTISVDAAHAVQTGFGATDLSALPLLDDAQTVDADELRRRARDLRAELDADAVARREKEQRDLRSFTVWRRSDGMVGGRFLLDPVDGALIIAAVEAVLSPRRGGPRFVSAEQRARDAILDSDERSDEQIAADALVAMVQLAVDADPGTVFGSRRPAVRVVVRERVLATRTGSGHLEDRGEPVSVETIERMLCDTGIIGLSFDDDGQCVNVGRTQRLFTARQRIGLAVRDGGCRFPGCDRPPSWAEAHHVNQWHRDQGNTDLADGILLCRRHHLLTHNNHWQISRDGADYWLTPPPDIDPSQTRISMPPKGGARKARVLERRAG